jgi:hypothetical protein
LPALSLLISESVAAAGRATVEAAVFGTEEPAAIADAICRLCEHELGSPVNEGLFYAASVGCVAGARLADGSDVVVKAYQPRWTAAFLRGVGEVQAHLAAVGFPCPRPIAGPLRLGRALAVVEEHLPDPGPAPIEPAMLRASAAGLAEQVRLCGRLDGAALRDHPLRSPTSSLYPEPHSPVFDFAATAPGAEWIDALAARAKTRRDGDESAPVIAHTDWSARNVRLSAARVLAVYDWDSLALVPESTAVGQAAATWSATAEPGERAPSVAEIVEYVGRYEQARGRVFSRDEHRAIGGAVVYLLAYASRCEHAIDPEGTVHVRARPRLRADGEALLSFGA